MPKKMITVSTHKDYIGEVADRTTIRRYKKFAKKYLKELGYKAEFDPTLQNKSWVGNVTNDEGWVIDDYLNLAWDQSWG